MPIPVFFGKDIIMTDIKTDEKFQQLITSISVVLHNYLCVAKQSGTISINVDAIHGEVISVEVINRLVLNVDGLKNG